MSTIISKAQNTESITTCLPTAPAISKPIMLLMTHKSLECMCIYFAKLGQGSLHYSPMGCKDDV